MGALRKPAGPILLTGFEAYGSSAPNPSREAVARLHGQYIDGHLVVGACLPVSFKRGPKELRRLLRKYDPSLVLCVGLAASRTYLSVERIAVNMADARITDNDGERPVDTRLFKRAPTAYLASVPVKAMVARLRGRGFNAELSMSAGTYVCNAVFYSLMHVLQHRPGVRGGFIHVPPVHPGHGAVPTSLPRSLNDVVSSLRVCIEVGINVKSDWSIGMGTED